MIYTFDDVKTGDTILSQGTDFFSKEIEKRSRGFSHASIAWKPADFHNQMLLIEAIGKGVVLSYFPSALLAHGKPFLYPLKDEFDHKRLDIILWGFQQIQRVNYDFFGVAKNLFTHVEPDISRMFCSELVSLAYFNVHIIKKLTIAPRPGELPVFFKEIYNEGGELRI